MRCDGTVPVDVDQGAVLHTVPLGPVIGELCRIVRPPSRCCADRVAAQLESVVHLQTPHLHHLPSPRILRPLRYRAGSASKSSSLVATHRAMKSWWQIRAATARGGFLARSAVASCRLWAARRIHDLRGPNEMAKQPASDDHGDELPVPILRATDVYGPTPGQKKVEELAESAWTASAERSMNCGRVKP